MPVPPHGHRKADLDQTFVGEGGFADVGGLTAEVEQRGGGHVAEISGVFLATDPTDYVSWASVGEPAPCKVDDIMDGGGFPDGRQVSRIVGATDVGKSFRVFADVALCVHAHVVQMGC